MKVPLITASYQARSLIASAQRCVNLYAEKNPQDEDFPTTFYPTPGLVKKATAEPKVWRCLYTSSDNRMFGVCGRSVFEINADFSFRPIGLITSDDTPCYMLDNGTQILLVDGTIAGYTINLASLAFAQITNPAFYGSSRVFLVDGYLVLNRPDTQQWYISLVNQADFDSLDFASKTGFSDKLVAVGVTRRTVFLFGAQTTEIWTNTGGNDFPFTRLAGAFIQFGCASADSLIEADGSLYWLSQSPQGECIVLRTASYDRERISTFAIENEFQTYERIDDAIGYAHQMAGHYWYVLNFPTANKTWVYDIAASEWHELGYLEPDGSFSRHRGNCFAYWSGMHIVGDYENGNLYEMRTDAFTDNGNEIRRVKAFPHLSIDGNRVGYLKFQAAMQVGDATYAQEAEVRLRWSDTKGASWSQPISTTLGARGDYLKDCVFQRLGMARNRVFELSWVAACPTALNGAYVQTKASAT
jgi:hypothetical protein